MDPKKHTSSLDADPTTEAEGTVIVIQPLHVLGVVVLLAAFGGGLFFAAKRAPKQTPPASNLVASAPAVQVVGGPQELSPGQVIPLESGNPLVGQKYIDIVGATLDGQRAALKDLEGKPVMLNFWATWCPPCRVEMPWMEEAFQQYKDKGFTILAVDAGERVPADQVTNVVTSYVQGHGLTFPVLLADDAYKAQLDYQVYGLPSSYMISPDGNIVDAHRGMYPNRVTLLDRVASLMTE